MTECFDGVIEWLDVPIQPAGSAVPSFDSGVLPRGYTPATSVCRAADEETDSTTSKQRD